jgi:hypothetical protein
VDNVNYSDVVEDQQRHREHSSRVLNSPAEEIPLGVA